MANTSFSDHVLKGSSCKECGKSWPCPVAVLLTENTVLKAKVGNLSAMLANLLDKAPA